MNIGKAGLLTAGFVGTFALGVMTGPTIQDSWHRTTATDTPVASQPAETSAPAPAKADRPASRARSSSSRTNDVVARKKAPDTIQTLAVDLWEPELRDRAKAVLNRGARLELAAADFDSSEQFMTVAHAARNTQVPFMVLKDRVLNQGQSLGEAIREFKPGLNVRAELARARAAARKDLELAS
jgi:hypothetical protein